MTATGPFIVTQRQRDRMHLDAGECRNVCAACGARMVVPPAAGHAAILTHEQDCERSWGFTPDEAIRYEDGTQATVDNWPSGVEHTRVVYREAFATLDEQTIYNALYAAPIEGDKLRVAQQIAALPESAGTIEPITLPNGDVIEVEATRGDLLFVQLSAEAQEKVLAEGRGTERYRELTVAAWNAEHGIGIGEAR